MNFKNNLKKHIDKYKINRLNTELMDLISIGSRKFINDKHSLDKKISKLLSKGANPNYKDSAGMTPLIAAVRSNSTSDSFMVKKLLYAGAQSNTRDCYNMTALDWAKKENNIEVLNIFNNHKYIDFNDKKRKISP